MPLKVQQIKNWLYTSFNLSILKNPRLAWVDYLRGIAIILVVYRHALLGIEKSNIPVSLYLEDANMIFYSFRMPLFFILSGIFISRTLKRKKVKEIVFSKFETLFYPYLVWTFLQISLQIIFGYFTNANRGLIDYTYIFYQPRRLDQFWYLPALFNSTLVYLFFKTKVKIPNGFNLMLGLLFYYASPYFQKISMISDAMEFYVFLALGDFISEMFFEKRVQDFFKKRTTLLVSSVFFMASQLYYLQHNIGLRTLITDVHEIQQNSFKHFLDQTLFLVVALIGCITITNIAFLLEKKGYLKFLRVLGYHSLQIYVMHVMITSFIRMSMPRILGIDNPIVMLLMGIVFGTLLPIIFYNSFIKDKWLWFLFTYKKRPPVKESKEKTSFAPAVTTDTV